MYICQSGSFMFPESAVRGSAAAEIPLASRWFVPVSMFDHFYAKESWSDAILAML